MTTHTNPLVEAVSFRDELARVTEFRPEFKGATEITEPLVNPTDFTEPPPAPIETIEAETIPHPVEEAEPYDAQANASALVYTLTAIDGLLLSFAVQMKCRSNIGGSKIIKKMKLAMAKELTGSTLSAHETTLINRFKEFKSNMQLLSGEISPNDTEIKRLIDSALPYCEQSQIKVGAGTAFWVSYVGNLTQRVTKILTA